MKRFWNALSIVQAWKAIFENDAHEIVSCKGWEELERIDKEKHSVN